MSKTYSLNLKFVYLLCLTSNLCDIIDILNYSTTSVTVSDDLSRLTLCHPNLFVHTYNAISTDMYQNYYNFGLVFSQTTFRQNSVVEFN